MHLFITLLALTVITGFAASASAMDEFGARFGSDAPTALTDNVEDGIETKSPEEALSEIAPAAGDEEPATPSTDAAEAQAPENDAETPSAGE